ncbi:hypothetical protein Y88_1724 [Novosphingobium nitrogenifigens DSM 19370]|uniref:Uncharacterized protein n=1 Tax=Novosphingobium nitrogenifigens DSM 19370 TaxID=983920 RepID=F1Z3M1_9SPHN|nr:hypothetical protein Y88_1724 [Novosphingobium nitrogenifigens DSM 19370]
MDRKVKERIAHPIPIAGPAPAGEAQQRPRVRPRIGPKNALSYPEGWIYSP